MFIIKGAKKTETLRNSEIYNRQNRTRDNHMRERGGAVTLFFGPTVTPVLTHRRRAYHGLITTSRYSVVRRRGFRALYLISDDCRFQQTVRERG